MEMQYPSLINIPWEDVLFPKVFSFLSYDDLLNLQQAFPEWGESVDEYFALLKVVNMSIESSRVAEAICLKTTNLRHLDLSHNKYIIDPLMAQVIRNNPLLRFLNICNCPLLSCAGVRPIINSKRLKSVCVRRNHWVTNSFVDIMTIHVTQLEEVDLGLCRVDNASLIPLFYTCRRLRRIDLEGNRYITDATLYAIANNCTWLESLNISGSKRVGETSVRFVTDLCPRLRCLGVRDCDRLSLKFIRGLRKNIYLQY